MRLLSKNHRIHRVLDYDEASSGSLALAWALGNLLFAWLISLRYVGYVQPDGVEQWGYLLLVFLGHIPLLVWLGASPLFLLAVLLRGVWLWLVTTLWASALQLLLLLDTFVYAQYRFHLSGFILDLLLNAGGDVFSFPWVAWALAIGGVLLMLVLQGGRVGCLSGAHCPSW